MSAKRSKFRSCAGTQGEVSLKSMGKTAPSAVGNPPDAKPGHPRTTGNTADQNRLMPCTGKPFELSNESELESNPKVGVMVEVGERYADFRGILIRGHCEVIEDPQVVKETMRLAGESATAAVPSGAVSSAPKRVVLKITPYRIASWDHTKLGGKY